MIYRLLVITALAFPLAASAEPSSDTESVLYSYLLEGARIEGSPISDLALAHHFRTTIRASGDQQTTPQAKVLLLEMDNAATAMEARVEPLIMGDPKLLTLRLGPLKMESDTAAQRALWAEQLEKIGKDNVYSGIKVMDRAPETEDGAALLRGVVMAANGKAYDDYNLEVMRAVSTRYAKAVVPTPPLRGTSPVQIAIDAAGRPMADLYDNSWLCRADDAGLRKICSSIYYRIATEALDPDTAFLAAVVLETIGDPSQKSEARRIRRSTDWLLYNVGKLLIGGRSKGLAAHNTDRITFGLLEAHRNLLLANGIGSAPADWVSPNLVESLDGPGDKQPSQAN